MDAGEGRLCGLKHEPYRPRVTNQIVTIFSKTCDNLQYHCLDRTADHTFLETDHTYQDG